MRRLEAAYIDRISNEVEVLTLEVIKRLFEKGNGFVVMEYGVGQVILHHYPNAMVEGYRVTYQSTYIASINMHPNKSYLYEHYGRDDFDSAAYSFIAKTKLRNPLDGFDQTPRNTKDLYPRAPDGKL